MSLGSVPLSAAPLCEGIEGMVIFRTLSLSWDIQATIIPARLTISWDTLNSMGTKTLDISWDINRNVLSTLDISWDINRIVSISGNCRFYMLPKQDRYYVLNKDKLCQ